jgi:hypothetical protein
MLTDRLTSDDVLTDAFAWVCQQRENDSHNSDVWTLRQQGGSIKPQVQRMLREGRYRFAPLHEYRFDDGVKRVWCAQDALVLKALARVLTPACRPQLRASCTHIQGLGGMHAAVRQVRDALPQHDFFVRTDAKDITPTSITRS